MIGASGFVVEGLFVEFEGFNEVRNCRHAGVAVATNAAVFALKVGAELPVGAHARENRLVVFREVVLAKLVHVVPVDLVFDGETVTVADTGVNSKVTATVTFFQGK